MTLPHLNILEVCTNTLTVFLSLSKQKVKHQQQISQQNITSTAHASQEDFNLPIALPYLAPIETFPRGKCDMDTTGEEAIKQTRPIRPGRHNQSAHFLTKGTASSKDDDDK